MAFNDGGQPDAPRKLKPRRKARRKPGPLDQPLSVPGAPRRPVKVDPLPKPRRTREQARVRYLTTAPSPHKSRKQTYVDRGKIGKRPGMSAVAMRIGKYDSEKHGVADPVARDVRRLLSKNRSPKEKRAALTNLQALGVVKDGKIVSGRLFPPTPKVTRKPPKKKESFGDKVDSALETTVGAVVDYGKITTDAVASAIALPGKASEELGVGSNERVDLASGIPGLPSPVRRKVSKTLKKGLASSGGVLFEGLDRPVAAVEASIAKAAAEVGAFKPAKRKRIKAARGSLEVLKHGRNWKKDVTGGDLTEAAGVGRHLGVAADIAFDPITYLSVGLAPETGGTSLALLVKKIERVAPELLKTPEVASALKSYNRGDVASHAWLKDALNKATKNMSRSRKAPLARARAEESTAAVKKALAESPELKIALNKRRSRNLYRKKEEARTTRIPVGNDAVVMTLRRGEDRRVNAVPRISFATPLGRRTSHGINLNLPGIGNLPVRPIGEATRNKLYDVAGRKAVAAKKEKRRLVIEELEGRIGSAQRRKKTELADQLRADLAKYKREGEVYTRDEIRELGREAVGPRHTMRIQDVADQINTRRVALHPFKVQADEYGRTTQSLFSRAQEDSAKILKGSPKVVAQKVKRVQLSLIAKTENLGGHGVITQAIKLAPDEQKYADNLMAIQRAQLEHGRKTGVLRAGQDDYVGMRIWEKLNNPQEIGENVANAIKNRSSTTGFQRHRAVASVTDRASEAELAESIYKLQDAGAGITKERARDLARDLFVRGKHRATAELVGRRIQRGEEVKWEDLTPTEQKAVDWASTHRDGSANGFLTDNSGNPLPMFRSPLYDESTEGLVLLDNADRYGFTNDLPNLPAEKRTLADFLSARKDQQQVAAMRAGLAPDQVAEHADLTTIHDRLEQGLSGNVLAEQTTANADALAAAKRSRRGTPEGKQLRAARIAKLEAERDTLIEQTAAHSAMVNAVKDSDGNLWLRGPENHDDPPITGMPKRPAYEAGPLDDPFDFTSRIPDARTEGKMVVLDPRVTGYLRSKAQGATSAYNARWKGVDAVVGRSAAEFDDRVAVAADGSEIRQADLVPQRDENGQITRYRIRGEDERVFEADDLRFPEATLIPNTDRSIWLDPRDGQEYVRPSDALPSGLMIHEIGPDRLWPTQAVDALQHEMITAGELDSAGKLDNEFLDATYDVGINHGIQRVMSMVRFGVTTPFPAYHVRNLISDLIKSLQSDSGVLFHPIANAKLTAAAFHRGGSWKLNIPGMGKMTTEDFLFVADLFGVRSGHHVAEVANLLKKGEFTESTIKKHMQNSWFVPGGKSTRFGANREDIARYMTFLQAMRSNGGDAAAAAFQMTRHHFNYNDLNRVERKTMRNIFLFYTWYRKNIPLQLVELARRPGFFAAVSHVYNSLEEGQTPLNIGPFSGAAPFQPGKPDYLRDKLQAATVNWKGYAMNVGFGAPWGDLQWLSLEGLEDSPTMLSPAATIPLQQIFRVDPMTHRRYKSNEPGGIATLWEHLMPGTQLPKDEHGNPTLPWRTATLLRQLPLIGRATFSIGSTPNTRDPGRMSRFGQLLSPITGLNINVAPRPGSSREEMTARKDVEGRLVQGIRRQGLEDLSNLPKEGNAYIRALKEIQRRLDEEAARGGTTQYLKDTPQSGHYIKKSRRKARPTELGGGGSLGGGLGSSGLGG